MRNLTGHSIHFHINNNNTAGAKALAIKTIKTMALQFKFNDGGRSQYFKKANVSDCVVRAMAIATGRDYKEIYDLCTKYNKATPRNGVSKNATKKIAEALGGEWHATMQIGTGCTTHLRDGEIPMDAHIVCNLSGHVAAVIDGVLNDTYDCSRNGMRCVYGYWVFK